MDQTTRTLAEYTTASNFEWLPAGTLREAIVSHRPQQFNLRVVDKCKETLYTSTVIKSLRHRGLELSFRTGKKSGIQPFHAERLRVTLGAIDDAPDPQDLSAPRLGLHQLSGNLTGFWAVKMSDNWRVIFRFEDEDVVVVDYLDNH